jgi:hypothetical protein
MDVCGEISMTTRHGFRLVFESPAGVKGDKNLQASTLKKRFTDIFQIYVQYTNPEISQINYIKLSL